MNISMTARIVLAGAMAALFILPASAQPGIDSCLEHRAYMQAEPDDNLDPNTYLEAEVQTQNRCRT